MTKIRKEKNLSSFLTCFVNSIIQHRQPYVAVAKTIVQELLLLYQSGRTIYKVEPERLKEKIGVEIGTKQIYWSVLGLCYAAKLKRDKDFWLCQGRRRNCYIRIDPKIIVSFQNIILNGGSFEPFFLKNKRGNAP